MKKRNLTIAILCMAFSPLFTAAQTILSVTPGAGGTQPARVNVQVDNITLNNTTSAISQPGSKTPRNVVWIEYGDGQFTTSPESSHLFYQNAKTAFPMMLVKSTGIYDPGGKPPKHTAKPIANLATGTQAMPGNIIFEKNDESVRITPNVFDVVPGDTMMVALTYRKSELSAAGLYRLLFFYNNEGLNVFEPIKPLNRYPVRDHAGQIVNVPFLRTHNGEQLAGISDLPADIYTTYRRQLNSSGYLIFNIPLNDNAEHHIFLTIVPRHDIATGENLLAGMDAVLIPPDKTPPQTYNYTSRIGGGPASHDPNWQEVFPKCIVLPKSNQEMKHHIHFQNTGAGPALSVRVRTSIPTGLTCNDINVTRWAIGGKVKNSLYSMDTTHISQDSIEFAFVYQLQNTNKVLYGAAELPDAPVNAKTMGDIYFTCKAKPGTPNTMKSGTSIYFDLNEAVKTEETKVEFKKCCDCDKECRKYKGRFLKWLLCKEC